jgi:hypothetical protein
MGHTAQPTVERDENGDLIDPRIKLDKNNHKHCMQKWTLYNDCVKRLAQKLPENEGKHCGGWYNNYWKCVDSKTAEQLFHYLK